MMSFLDTLPAVLASLDTRITCREIAASIARLRRAFDDRVLALPPDDVNCVAIAAVGAPIRTSPAVLGRSAGRLRADTGLNLLPTVARLERESGKPRRKDAKAQRKAR